MHKKLTDEYPFIESIQHTYACMCLLHISNV